MARLGKEHVNGLRERVEDAARHFLWWSFATGASLFVEDMVEQGRFKDSEAKRLICTVYFYWVHLFERWLTGDIYNETLEANKVYGLDEEMRVMSCGCYKWQSAPPSSFDIDRDIKTPKIIEEYFTELRSQRLAGVAKSNVKGRPRHSARRAREDVEEARQRAT
jgi:hypothetical protein